MGCMFRSDSMTFCEMYIQVEAAFEAFNRMGQKCCVQFLDMNEEVNAFHRKYVTEVCRCEEMERKLRFIEGELNKDQIPVPPLKLKDEPDAMKPSEMNSYEMKFEKWENELVEMASNQKTLLKNYLELSEMFYVLKHIEPILGDAEIYLSRAGELEQEGQLTVVSGVVMRSKCYPLEKMLWRISRGNIFFKSASEDALVTDPVTRTELRKVAFLVICQGTQLSARMMKVCNGFHAHIYPCPNTAEERADTSTELSTRIEDLNKVLEKTNYSRCKILRTVAKQLKLWVTVVKKAKAIFHHLNLLTSDVTKKCLIGRCWIPDSDLKHIQNILNESSNKVGTNVPSFLSKLQTKDTPPTYHRTNKFTSAFQNLIGAYGDSQYREVNPGLYTIITFPFLFAVMFGDVGHALIMFLFGFWMVYNEKRFLAERSTDEIWNMFFGGRYIILLMGLFSIYTGFLYNDVFGVSMTLKPSTWAYNVTAYKKVVSNITIESILLDPLIDLDPQPYIFGVDPLWSLAKNKIVALNSLKMKLSITIGVIHMLFGLAMSCINHLYFKHYHAIFLEFIPQVIFLSFTFLYMVFMMFFKWFSYTGYPTKNPKRSAGCAPLILIYFIEMVLMKTTKPVGEGCDAYMYPYQQQIQTALLLIALLCVPILLFGSPVYETIQNNKKRKILMGNKRYISQLEPDVLAKIEKLESFGEMMTHQGVHTIEFVLSTISHTASYLRLWALSLAHAQLAHMLWKMVFSGLALQTHSYFGVVRIFLIFPVWAVFSVGIMVLMEGLSAFLHTLRLHWVEFMSKFFVGNGDRFQPFCFQTILNADTEDKPSAFCSKLGKRENV